MIQTTGATVPQQSAHATGWARCGCFPGRLTMPTGASPQAGGVLDPAVLPKAWLWVSLHRGTGPASVWMVGGNQVPAGRWGRLSLFVRSPHPVMVRPESVMPRGLAPPPDPRRVTGL